MQVAFGGFLREHGAGVAGLNVHVHAQLPNLITRRLTREAARAAEAVGCRANSCELGLDDNRRSKLVSVEVVGAAVGDVDLDGGLRLTVADKRLGRVRVPTRRFGLDTETGDE